MRVLSSLALLAFAAVSHAAPTYLGLYLQGQKVGYASYETQATTLEGHSARRSDSRTVMDLGLLGQATKLTVDSSTWTKPTGEPIRMHFVVSSGGRTQKLDAIFNGPKVSLNVENGGRKSSRTVDAPKGEVVDDPLTLILDKGTPSRTFYVLDPMTTSFVKNDVRALGKATTDVKGKATSGLLFEIVDPRANTKAWISTKGDLIKAEAPMGIVMLPEPRSLAMAAPKGKPVPVDLAEVTSIRPTGTLPTPGELTHLKLRIDGRDMASVPSDAHQTISAEGKSWIVDVHPVPFSGDATIAQVHREKPEWTQPGLNIPSASPAFVALAKKIVGDRTDVKAASLAVKDWVYGQMKPNAGIGVLRDATEVLQTKEGVCRDYAVLAATLLRAAGIPTRVASGLVSWDGTFYYHAWDEVWDGKDWVGIDSTTPDPGLSAAHIKLADGSVEDAFTFPFLGNVKMKVLDARKG